jgi:hypothetical protein
MNLPSDSNRSSTALPTNSARLTGGTQPISSLTGERLMEQGIARTWEIPGAVLGALFYPDIYSGKQRAAVMFWFSEKRVRGTGAPVKLFDAFERAAEGCEVKSSAAHMNLVPQLRKFYLKKGYRLSEEVFSKYE